ncbi:YeeE/YedE thiosulfate transporter family protein [Desulfuromonas sp. AOP6]|uniref:YeeE/YedE thiosulfate transporter family protein n=1 Tax=Desulfuromonas sp. AOP6 TaxID=1566351 RepID=UPI001EE5C37D|nr:YeeE/YedE thiosulfate transporter family protein [Desulfuromonas sp. AOP6]
MGFLVFADLFWAAGGHAQIEAGPVQEAASATVGLLAMKAWSPYLAGAAIGILSWFAFLLSDHPLGVSTAFAKSSGMLEKALRGEKTLQKKYYQRFEPAIDWEWMLVLGLLIGAFLSAWLSGTFSWKFIPDLWAARFGDGVLVRGLTAFVGGLLIGLGARWANGCTSGHALSGAMQLVASGWVAAAGIFVGGVVTAFVIF